MKKSFLFFLFVFSFLLSISGTVDSLYRKIKTTTNDTVKAKSRYSIVDYYIHETNQYKLAMAHCDTLIEFCRQKNFYRMEAKAWIYRAYCDEYLGNYDLAVHSDSLALMIAQKKGYKKEAAHALQNMGNNFGHKGTYSKALEYFLNALRVQEELKDSVAMATMYHNSAIVYRLNSQYQQSLDFLRKAAAIRTRKKDRSLASTICSIGNYFFENEKNNDSALVYYNKALQLAQENNIAPTIALVKENLGNLYMKKKDYKTSEKYFKENLEFYEKLGERQGVSFSYYELANLYAEMGKKDLALDYAQRSVKIAEEIKSAEDIKVGYNALAELSSSFKDFETAFKFRTKEMKFKDSLYKESGAKAMAEMSQKYETEKKQKEILLLTEKSVNQELALSKSRIMVYGVLAVVLLLIAVAFVLVRNNRIKNEANKLLTYQKHVIEEKNKEITDSIKYAQRIQNAILPSTELIKKYLPESFIYYLPKDIVSGDIYYLQAVKAENGNEEIIVSAIDCTGHGVPGALVSVIGFNALNSAVKEFKINDPGKILDKVRELVVETFNTAGNVKDGMDMSLLSIISSANSKPPTDNSEQTTNSRLQTIKWSGANNPLWIVRKGETEVEEYKPNKQPIGHVDTPQPFTTHEILVNKGDQLYIFTDGYADQFGGEKGKKLKSSNMKKLLLNVQHNSMEKQKERIRGEFQAWKNSLEQVDDVCIIGIKI